MMKISIFHIITALLLLLSQIFGGADGDTVNIDRSLSTHTLGSAQELEGRILVVSVFADDMYTSWDFEGTEADYELYCDIYSYLGTAADWITASGKKYGKDIELIWDWTENEDLFYYAAFGCDFPASIETGESEYYSWTFIDDNIDSDALLEKYAADSIVYMMYFDTPPENEVSTCTRNYYEGMEYPYEVCYMFMQDNGYGLCPAIFAHEMLHTFGAPDLYCADPQFGISEEYAEYAEQTQLNDIMRICGDPATGEMRYDSIINEVTDITAYYIGWTESSRTVKRWKMGKSEHV